MPSTLSRSGSKRIRITKEAMKVWKRDTSGDTPAHRTRTPNTRARIRATAIRTRPRPSSSWRSSRRYLSRLWLRKYRKKIETRSPQVRRKRRLPGIMPSRMKVVATSMTTSR